LPDWAIEDLREQFKPAEQYLTIHPQPQNLQELRRQTLIDTVKLSGLFTDDQIVFLSRKTSAEERKLEEAKDLAKLDFPSLTEDVRRLRRQTIPGVF
ncbi:MAG: hypothetical protein HY619_02505, partial [Thaumarchaeota archaeon]|nr:hypothetical protein [Nitrososphaerota archaeon]